MVETFDQLTREIGTSVSRRQAVRAAGAGFGAAVAALLVPSGAGAAPHACPPSKGGTPCFDSSGSFTGCCPKGSVCCSGVCCATSASCCGGTTCCPSGQICCGSTCCKPGTLNCVVSADGVSLICSAL
jgi:hypothetical protein